MLDSVKAAGLASEVARLKARFVIKDSDSSLRGAAQAKRSSETTTRAEVQIFRPRCLPNATGEEHSHFAAEPNTFCNRSVVRAAGLSRIDFSCSAIFVNRPSKDFRVT